MRTILKSYKEVPESLKLKFCKLIEMGLEENRFGLDKGADFFEISKIKFPLIQLAYTNNSSPMTLRYSDLKLMSDMRDLISYDDQRFDLYSQANFIFAELSQLDINKESDIEIIKYFRKIGLHQSIIEELVYLKDNEPNSISQTIKRFFDHKTKSRDIDSQILILMEKTSLKEVNIDRDIITKAMTTSKNYREIQTKDLDLLTKKEIENGSTHSTKSRGNSSNHSSKSIIKYYGRELSQAFR